VYVPSKSPVKGEDDNVEVLHDELQTTTLEEASVDSNLNPYGDVEGR